MIRLIIAALITAAILSVLLVLAFVQAGADKGMVSNTTDKESLEAGLISQTTEDLGIFAIGLSLGPLILPFINRRRITNANPNLMAEKYIFVSIATMIMAAGIIHILLVKEHMEESYMWGIGFIVMGISQLSYGGVFVVLANNNLRKVFKRSVVRSFYSIGIAGNVSLAAIFIYVRLFVPPFSPEATPVNEIEANGILTVVMEIFIVGLLVYLVKRERLDEKPMINLQAAG